MNPLDRLLLLASLSFFFACLAVSLISVYYNNAVPPSYIYSAQLDPAQTSPLEDAERQYNALPKSVLHYSNPPVTANTVQCYLEEEFKKILNERMQAGATLAARAIMDGDDIEIYAKEDGGFFVFAIGPDALGQREACEVAAGTDWRVLQR